jgi:hypothetical protein
LATALQAESAENFQTIGGGASKSDFFNQG